MPVEVLCKSPFAMWYPGVCYNNCGQNMVAYSGCCTCCWHVVLLLWFSPLKALVVSRCFKWMHDDIIWQHNMLKQVCRAHTGVAADKCTISLPCPLRSKHGLFASCSLSLSFDSQWTARTPSADKLLGCIYTRFYMCHAIMNLLERIYPVSFAVSPQSLHVGMKAHIRG